MQGSSILLVGAIFNNCRSEVPSANEQEKTVQNNTDLKFVDISSEAYRRYTFPGGDTVTITEPTQLNVNAGGHRILDASETSHYIPKGWIHLEWKAKAGQPNFVK